MKQELNEAVMESVAGGTNREELVRDAIETAKKLHLGEETLTDQGPTVIRAIGSGDPPHPEPLHKSELIEILKKNQNV